MVFEDIDLFCYESYDEHDDLTIKDNFDIKELDILYGIND